MGRQLSIHLARADITVNGALLKMVQKIQNQENMGASEIMDF